MPNPRAQKPRYSYKNVSGHPLTLDDGRVIETGASLEVDKALEGTLARAAIDSGHLAVHVPEGE